VRKSRLLLLLAAVLAAAYVAALPTRARVLPPLPASAAPIHGAIHVHSRVSDGTGTVDTIAAAAARAGLNFVILTDHGDGTRKPDPPAYHNGVLVIDAVEVSTEGGHVVGLGLGSESPYPLAGEPRDVVDDIVRLGGFAIAAHPGSAKPELQWIDWNVPISGLEWLNADSEWRDESGWSLLHALLTYPARGAESVATLLDRPSAVLARWDDLTKTRRIAGVAALDAHARIGMRSVGEPYDSRVVLPIPSYEAMFRTFSIALPGVTLRNDAGRDAAAVLAAVREGRLYSRIDSVAGPGALTFTARSGRNVAQGGEVLALDGPVTLRVETIGPPGSRVAILRNGAEIRSPDGTPIEDTEPAEPAVYRVEVRLPGAPGTPPVPWLVSNPIYVGRSAAATAALPAAAKATAAESLYDNGEASGAKTEHSEQAQGVVDVIPAVEGGRQLLFRYALGGRPSEAPYAAMTFPAMHAAQFDRLAFSARADRPMRLTVQLRVPGGQAGERWQRSVYLDETTRTITIPFSEMTSVGRRRTGPPPLAAIDSFLLVVDTVNTKLGGNGTVWLDDLRFER